MQSTPVGLSDPNLTNGYAVLPEPSARIWSMAELREQARAQGLSVVEASYSRAFGWTARTAPRRTALSRTYEVSNLDALTGRATRYTVTVSNSGTGCRYEVDGDYASADLALTLLETCTHLRLVGETLAGEVAA